MERKKKKKMKIKKRTIKKKRKDFAIWKYSLISRGWVKCKEMNHPRCLFGSGSLGSIAIVAGGSEF